MEAANSDVQKLIDAIKSQQSEWEKQLESTQKIAEANIYRITGAVEGSKVLLQKIEESLTKAPENATE